MSSHPSGFRASDDAMAKAGVIRGRLRGLQSAGDAVGRQLALRCPGLAPVGPLGMQLADAAAVGLEALGVLDHSTASAVLNQDLAIARLKADSEPHDGADLAIIAPIRQLVLAAAAAANK